MQLGRLEAPFEPKLRAAITAFDCGNEQVNGYLQGYAETIVAHELGTVLVLTEDRAILGFVSLSFSSIVLTNSEKGSFRSVRTAFGAVRVGSNRGYAARGWTTSESRARPIEGRELVAA